MKNLFIIAPAFLLFACGGEVDEAVDTIDDAITVIDETVNDVPAVEVIEVSTDDEILAYLAEKGWEGTKHESGMYIVTDAAGEGDARPVLTDEVTIFYEGFLLDGFRFDGTSETPATFPLMNLIQGWQIGIPMFGKGGKGKLIIPSDLAYGPYDNGDIPGGSTLMFEIELVDWQPAM